MKLSENVETKTGEVKASDSRASRMARYSAAAAGVAAVSSIEVDAAMIKVIVTDPDAQNTNYYELDLSHLYPLAHISINQSSSGFSASMGKTGQIAISSSASSIAVFNNGSTIGSGENWNKWGASSISSGSTNLFGFRAWETGGNYTYGWFKATIVSSSAFTLNSYGYNSTLNAAAIAGQPAGVPDSGPGIVGLALIGAGAAGVRLLRKLRAGK